MSDPRKNFICSKCGYVMNDSERTWGDDTPCPECIRNEVLRGINNESNSNKGQ